MGACTGLLAGKASFAMGESYKHKMFMKSTLVAFSYKKRLGLYGLFLSFIFHQFSHITQYYLVIICRLVMLPYPRR
jgi:hypothetical protein